MSDFNTILHNSHIFFSPAELTEQIEAVTADIASWQKTIDENTEKIVDLALESMQARNDIEAAKISLVRLYSRQLGIVEKAVIQ